MPTVINKVHYHEPESAAIAKAQSQNTKPYKPVYATEAYEAAIKEAAYKWSKDTSSFPSGYIPTNPDVAARVKNICDALKYASTHTSEDVDVFCGESNWFFDIVYNIYKTK